MRPARARRCGSAAVGRCLLFAALCVGLFIAARAPVEAGVYYSESWLDDSSPESGAVIVGCGVTDMSGEWEYHHARVETTLRSPGGREDTVFIEDWAYPQYDGAYPYARVEVTLPLDFNDLGDYLVESIHTSTCPVGDFGFTQRPFHFSTHSYQRSPQGDFIASCIGRCTRSRRLFPLLVHAQFIQCGSFSNPTTGFCYEPAVCVSLPTPGTCTN